MEEQHDDHIGLFDLDGSLAGFDQQLLADLELLRSPMETEAVFTDLRAKEWAPWFKARIDLIKRQPGWWANLPRIEKGFKVLQLAKDLEFDNRVVTKGPRTNSLAWKEKLEWVFNNADGIDVTITFDKSNVYGKFLYDDYLPFCLKWLAHRRRGMVIMPVERFDPAIDHPQILQFDGSNIKQVWAALIVCRRRKPHEAMVIPRLQGDVNRIVHENCDQLASAGHTLADIALELSSPLNVSKHS